MLSAFNDQTVPTPEVIAMLARAELAPTKKRPLGMADVRMATVSHSTGQWLVCRAPQDPGCARLLDVVVHLRGASKLPCPAILEPPRDKPRKLGVKPSYLSAYQTVAWSAFEVALVLDDGERSFAPSECAPSPSTRAQFEELANEVASALHDDSKTALAGTRWALPEDSREAEALVRLTMNRVLRTRGYLRRVDGGALAKSYKGFWRSAEADGMWTNDAADVRHIALESKLNEDIEAPLCQVVDHLAHVTSAGGAGGVVCVRVYKPGHEPHEPTSAMKHLEEAALVRYLAVRLS